MSLWMHVGVVWLGSAAVMAALWAMCMRLNNVGYVDVGWAGMMALAALYASAVGAGAPLPRLLVAALGSLWAVRLCLHLLHRVTHETEDGRYQSLRAKWNSAPSRFFVFFQMQALVVALFAIPFFVAANQLHPGFTWKTALAIAIWLLAVGGEALADHQLARFRADAANKGKTCRVGLWAWSRHPNYFFEWLHWFSYVVLTIGAPQAWLSWLGPLAMLAFLYRISGIPWTEQQSLRSRGEDYRRYQNEVSAFVPMPPRRAGIRDLS